MRKILSLLFVIMLITTAILFSCNKTKDVHKEIPQKVTIDFFTVNPKIADAKNYFESQVVTSTLQKFKKNACVGKSI